MKKGGYQVIDLKDFNITSEGVVISGLHSSIVENKRKVILLSGVTINGVEFSDMFVKVVKTGSDYRLTGYSVAVDGDLSTYDFFVEEDDTITLIEDEVESGEPGMENPMTTAGDIIVGGEEGAPARLAKGTAGQVLKAGENGLEWGADSAGMTNPMTTMGDIIAGSVDGAPYRLPKGTPGQVLTMGVSVPEWSNPQGGGKYLHTIYMIANSASSNYSRYMISLQVVTDSATPLTEYTIINALKSFGEGAVFFANGFADKGDSQTPVASSGIGIYYIKYVSSGLRAYGVQLAAIWDSGYVDLETYSPTSLSDYVVAL